MAVVSVSAPGKIILFGEHAVVYGQPAIAAPLTAVQVTATAEPGSPGSGLILHAADLGQTIAAAQAAPDDPFFDALVYPAQLVLEHLRAPMPDLRLTVRSTIPVASGLGSGAALATAIMRALAAALDAPLTDDALNPLVYEVEKRHHGTPSGIDNTVIVYARPVYFVRGTTPQTFAVARPFTLLVADSGQSSPTRLTVADVRRLHDADPPRLDALFACIGEIVRAARQSIESGDVDSLGSLMDENHALLRELTVSSDLLDRLCQVARAAGARGAKLSGGGRGGAIIALVDEPEAAPVTIALRRAGAVRVLSTPIQQGP
ncbi:MAG: mevalonate kinase [Anaerolineae bacterium]|nr:mevalonate kinase [Anaerolineae bacterium]